MKVVNNKLVIDQNEFLAISMNCVRAYNRKFNEETQNYATTYDFFYTELQTRSSFEKLPEDAKKILILKIMENMLEVSNVDSKVSQFHT